MIWGSRVRAGVRRRSTAYVVAVAALSLLGSACASGSVESAIEAPLPDFIRPCEEQYADGELIDYDEGTFSDACRDEAGELVSPRPTTLPCTDGPDLLYHEFAWGYEGDEMTVFPPGVDERRPDEEVIRDCLQHQDDGGEETA